MTLIEELRELVARLEQSAAMVHVLGENPVGTAFEDIASDLKAILARHAKEGQDES